MNNKIITTVATLSVSSVALIATLLVSTAALASAYNGTSTTYGNTTYHSGSDGP